MPRRKESCSISADEQGFVSIADVRFGDLGSSLGIALLDRSEHFLMIADETVTPDFPPDKRMLCLQDG